MVFNDIIPGFPWSQIFRFPAGAIPGGMSLKIDFRLNAARPVLFTLTEGNGIVRTGDDFMVNLTDVQTMMFDSVQRTSFDLKRDDDVHLGLRVHVPVSDSL